MNVIEQDQDEQADELNEDELNDDGEIDIDMNQEGRKKQPWWMKAMKKQPKWKAKQEWNREKGKK